MWPLVPDEGRCGNTRVHDAEDFWTCPVAMPKLIFGADGLMLGHGAPLERYMPLEPLLTMVVFKRGSGAGEG